MKRIVLFTAILIIIFSCGGGNTTEPQEHQYVEWTGIDTSQWDISANDFEHVMTMTAILSVDGDTLNSANNKIVAVVNESIRSRSLSYEHLGNQIYALNLYSNNLTDTLYFAAWIEELGMIVTIENKVPFEVHGAYGNPDNPYNLIIE